MGPMTVLAPERVAPEALRAIATMAASAELAAPLGSYGPVRKRMAHLMGVTDRWRPGSADGRLDELAAWPTSSRFSPADRAALTMAEQFVLDVSLVTDGQRAELREALGEDAATLVDVLHAIDFELRLRAVGTQLLGGDPLAGVEPGEPLTLPDALDRVTRLVARLEALDPLTTELVRLRGARVHNCRMCQALRHHSALEAGGDEALYDRIDDYESSELTERHKAALRLTDAVLARPGSLPEMLVSDVDQHFTSAEALEILLDVQRNARNKVAVANGTDADGVGEGLTVYHTRDGVFELVSTGPGVSDPRGRF